MFVIGYRSLVHARAANSNIKPNIITAMLNHKHNKYAGYCLDACEVSLIILNTFGTANNKVTRLIHIAANSKARFEVGCDRE